MTGTTGKTSVLFKGTKSGKDVGVVHAGKKEETFEFKLGGITSGVPAEVVKELEDNPYYEDYEFDFNPKESE